MALTSLSLASRLQQPDRASTARPYGIQKAHAAELSSANPTTLADTLDLAKEARARGLKVPIVLMGY